MTGVLDGKVALVTGAAGGLGQAIAQRLEADGAVVARSDLEDGFACDLSDPAAAAALPDRVREEHGALDILVNNAGVRQIAPLLDVSVERWQQTLDVDLTAPFLLSQAAIPGMIEAGGGKIINVASMAGQLAFQERVAYCVAKAGLIMLTKVIAMEFGAQGIHCNAVGPGVIETPLTKDYFTDETLASAIRAQAPMARWGQPEEIADPVAYLAGPGATFVNGTTLFVDGGWTAAKGY